MELGGRRVGEFGIAIGVCSEHEVMGQFGPIEMAAIDIDLKSREEEQTVFEMIYQFLCRLQADWDVDLRGDQKTK